MIELKFGRKTVDLPYTVRIPDVSEAQFDDLVDEDMKAELIPFDMGRLLLYRDESQNLPLKPLDEVYVFSRWMFEDKPSASIEGEVRKPGRYVIDKMKVKDLVFKAGSLTRDA